MVKWNCPDDVPVGEKSSGQLLFTTARRYDTVEVGSSNARTYFIVYAIAGMRDLAKGWHIRQIDNPGHRPHSVAPGVEGGLALADGYTLSEGIKKAQDTLYQTYSD